MYTEKQKYEDAMFGLAIGDALGVPYEFNARGSFEFTGMTGFGTYNEPAGTWSDDTSMAIATAKSIKDNEGKIDVDKYNSIVNYKDEVEVEMTIDELNALKK